MFSFLLCSGYFDEPHDVASIVHESVSRADFGKGWKRFPDLQLRNLGFPVHFPDEHDSAYGNAEENESGDCPASAASSAPAAGNGADTTKKADERCNKNDKTKSDGAKCFHSDIKSLLAA
jgi:hypothetical protein